MPGTDLRYVLYETVFDELRSATEQGDAARSVHIRTRVAGLPTLERLAATAAIEDVESRQPKRGRTEFRP